ncbi:nuclear transport factor 2 family protein [uncultured Flavobacterium sp.]|uniref:nuclear transport factor 2 family protein n=1 Tax=uncultured Flavobacterium sp. TaxID=165435 RepID=UPI0030EBD065|tara:strand:- start:306747 stop:307181 length:435 start_codon:yes stop_codon:yes gene_type:complete
MEKIFTVLLFLSASLLFSQEKEVQKTIEDFFVGLNSKDTTAIRKQCYKDVIVQTILKTKQGNQLKTDGFNDFLVSISAIPVEVKIEEKILNYKIEVDGNLAHVWTPYEFYVNGSLSHKGVNSFTLFKENFHWEIIHIIDTRRRN